MLRIVTLLFAACVCTSFVKAQEMSSQNYSIMSDSVNVGGLLSTSTNYNLEDTAGDIATGISTSTNFILYAGYQKQNQSDISLIPGDNVIMSSSIGGITGGTSNGSTTFTVISANDPGYTVLIRAMTSPAMTSGTNTFADYTPTGAAPDFVFSISADASEFGFSPEGDDIISRYRDNGSVCDSGSSDTSLACWDGLTTSDEVIVERMTSTASTGSATTINFRAAVGASRFQPEGVYIATTTITVLPL